MTNEKPNYLDYDCTGNCWNCAKLESYNTIFMKGWRCTRHWLIGMTKGIISHQATFGKLDDYTLKNRLMTDYLTAKMETKYGIRRQAG